MSSTVNIKAVGLVTQPNSLQSIEGALQVASNVIIRRDNVVESRRGFKLYGNTMGTTSDTAKQLLSYKDTLLRHYNDVIQYDSGSGVFVSFTGSYTEPVANIRIKSVESNGNFYITTDAGIKKLSAKTVADIATSTISSAGGVKALDVQASLSITLGDSSGFLPADSAVAYRIVWGIKDPNSNLILGTPSQRVEIYNPLSSLIAQDTNNLLLALDKCGLAATTELLNQVDYMSSLNTSYSAVGTTLKTTMTSLGAKLDGDILLANDTGAPLTGINISGASISAGICTITTSAGTPGTYLSTGSKIYLTSFSPVSGTLNGLQTVASATGTAGAGVITFATTATGAVTTGALSTVEWGEYRYILSTGSVDYPTSLNSLTIDTPATHDELATIQDTLGRFINRLKIESAVIINTAASVSFLFPLQTTTTTNVTLSFTIPDDVTTNHFYQIYRSSISEATGVTVLSDLTPSDELQLVYEAFPTTAELSTQVIEVTDVTPDAFRGANLYTNASTGEGILQSNDVPPASTDINKFKNYTFYANTRTRHRLQLSMLGIQALLNEYALGSTPRLTIADSNGSVTFTFVSGVQETTHITCAADVADSLNGKYFTLNAANNDRRYYFWYKTSGGAVSDPAVAGKIGVRIDITTGSVANTVAGKTRDAINSINIDFASADNTLPKIQVINLDEGPATDATAGTTGFTPITVITQGRGQDTTINQVLLSSQASVGIATDATARSLVEVINRSTSSVYAYYLSGTNDVPGKMFIESRTLGSTDNPFYVTMNSSATGASFNPDISPALQVNAGVAQIIKDSPSVGKVAFNVTGHGLFTGDQVLINGTQNATPTLTIGGIYTITKQSDDQFSITATIAASATVVANTISVTKLADGHFSDNEVKSNRIYYSKVGQPEAVPLLNFLDLGASDKAILRILPLRDSLFVFKEDGLFRVSGVVAPFNSALFDVSCLLLAPDSLGIVNNVIFGWTRKGLENITESGSNVISRYIDVDILPRATAAYTNFSTATFGVGYESDNSYVVWTVSEKTDTVATIAYRYSNLTNSWTTFNMTNTCGIIGSADDKMYLGAADTNYIAQERKDFERTDYADREYIKTVSAGFLTNSGKTLKFGSVSDFAPGDVILQTQTLTIYEYNAILQKLDIDPGVGDSNYYTSLKAIAGDNLRLKLIALATKLDADSGLVSTDYLDKITGGAGPYSISITSITVADPALINTAAAHGLYSVIGPAEGRWVSISGVDTNADVNGTFEITRIDADTFSVNKNVISVADGVGTLTRLENDFRDIRACYNIIMTALNNDVGASFSNYSRIDTDTELEVIVLSVNNVNNTVTVNLALDYVVGNITLYKHIETEIVYTPQTFGDPLGLKHIREATVMFEDKAFTSAILSFSSDLLPAYIDIPFNGSGNGIFGNGAFFGSDYFGGASHSAPFRTYVPRDCQRCRFLNIKFVHGTAREKYSLFGVSLTGEIGISSRGYR